MFRSLSVDFSSRKWTAVVCFSLFSGWMLSVAFEGSSFYERLSEVGLSPSLRVSVGPGFLMFLGLLTSGALLRSMAQARQAFLILVPVCIIGSGLLLTDLGWVWATVPYILSFVAGIMIASWGFWFKSLASFGERFTVAAYILVLSNVFMIIADIAGMGFGGKAGVMTGMVLLLGALFLARWLPATATVEAPERSHGTTIGPLLSLSAFITLITVNSGIMYSLFRPAFAQHTLLAAWYWAVPYMAALLLLKHTMEGAVRFRALMMGVASLGLSFVLFSALDRSVLSFLVIDTFMLGGCGVCDLFWWGTLGEMLEGAQNPARLFGIGMAANVLGIVIGKLFVPFLEGGKVGQFQSTHIASLVTIITIVSVPYLFSRLKQDPAQDESDDNPLPEAFSAVGQIRASVPDQVTETLTKRELEIVGELLTGKTYRMISESLHITENTTKYHIKNIYAKLGVRNKTELLRLLGQGEKPRKQAKPS